VGIEVAESIIDERGRIVIPNEIREELNLRPEQKLKVTPRGREIVLSPSVGSEEFIEQLKGCVHGSKIRPEELKNIWGGNHPHD
jgi:AbrB family looped-hinge helix DNA binding protein